MAKKIVFGNFKGGVGKTTNSVMVSYELSKLGCRVLVCDLDPQSNSTQLLSRTYNLQHNKSLIFEKTMMKCLDSGTLKNAITSIMDNLDLIPSFKDFVDYPDFLEIKISPLIDNYKEKRIAYFSSLLESIEQMYDFIIIDVPPTLSIFTDSALYSADYLVVVMQTQQRSLDGAEAFFEYIQFMYDKYESIDYDLLGVLPVLLKNDSPIDNQIISDASQTFGKDMIFSTIIRHMERLKRYDRLGILDEKFTSISDFHDRKVHDVYNELSKEILVRIGGDVH